MPVMVADVYAMIKSLRLPLRSYAVNFLVRSRSDAAFYSEPEKNRNNSAEVKSK